jgi:hypothetical protein
MEKETAMSRQVDLACTVCAEEFLVPIGAYRAHDGIVPCPCCGSTELFLLGEREGPRAAGAVAAHRTHDADRRLVTR